VLPRAPPANSTASSTAIWIAIWIAPALGLAALPLASGACGSIEPTPLAARAIEPVNKPVEGCIRACRARLDRQCSAPECERGCEYVLDRLVERETENVIRCVGKRNRRCTDVVWAECAAMIGPHADGGPPAPLPPSDDE